MTNQLLITDIFAAVTDIVGKTSQEDFSIRWLHQSESYLRTIKSQKRQPTIAVWEDLLASLLQYEKVITTKNRHPMLKQKAQQIRAIAELVAAHIAHQQIQNSQRRNEARILMLEAVKKAVASYDGTYTDDATPIAFGF
jgi:ribosomal protein L17